jgi:hypothetical protein
MSARRPKAYRLYLGITAAALALGARAQADSPTKKRVRAQPVYCVPAQMKDIRLPFPIAVDEVRVFVANHSPATGAATVRVDTGDFDRVMRIRGQVSKTLQFRPALAGRVFHVSLDPVLEAPRSACIERVELVRQGRRVATVRP